MLQEGTLIGIRAIYIFLLSADFTLVVIGGMHLWGVRGPGAHEDLLSARKLI